MDESDKSPGVYLPCNNVVINFRRVLFFSHTLRVRSLIGRSVNIISSKIVLLNSLALMLLYPLEICFKRDSYFRRPSSMELALSGYLLQRMMQIASTMRVLDGRKVGVEASKNEIFLI